MALIDNSAMTLTRRCHNADSKYQRWAATGATEADGIIFSVIAFRIIGRQLHVSLPACAASMIEINGICSWPASASGGGAGHPHQPRSGLRFARATHRDFAKWSPCLSAAVDLPWQPGAEQGIL